MKLKGLDYLGLEKHFSEEEIMVQHNTRDFVENEINPIIDKHFSEGTFPDDLISKFAKFPTGRLLLSNIGSCRPGRDWC